MKDFRCTRCDPKGATGSLIVCHIQMPKYCHYRRGCFFSPFWRGPIVGDHLSPWHWPPLRFRIFWLMHFWPWSVSQLVIYSVSHSVSHSRSCKVVGAFQLGGVFGSLASWPAVQINNCGLPSHGGDPPGGRHLNDIYIHEIMFVLRFAIRH